MQYLKNDDHHDIVVEDTQLHNWLIQINNDYVIQSYIENIYHRLLLAYFNPTTHFQYNDLNELSNWHTIVLPPTFDNIFCELNCINISFQSLLYQSFYHHEFTSDILIADTILCAAIMIWHHL